MEIDKEKWINEVLNSTTGIQRAKPGEFLFPKILNRLKNPEKTQLCLSKKKVALGFMTILVLGMLNVGTILFVNNSGGTEQKSDSVVKEYFPSQYRSLDQIFNR